MIAAISAPLRFSATCRSTGSCEAKSARSSSRWPRPLACRIQRRQGPSPRYRSLPPRRPARSAHGASGGIEQIPIRPRQPIPRLSPRSLGAGRGPIGRRKDARPGGRTMDRVYRPDSTAISAPNTIVLSMNSTVLTLRDARDRRDYGAVSSTGLPGRGSPGKRKILPHS